MRAIFKAFLPLTLTPVDSVVDKGQVLDSASLRKNFCGKRVLVVGGTKGIGASIVDTLRELGGADVTCVGRSARTISGGVAADLFTVKGCLDLVDSLLVAQKETNKGKNSNNVGDEKCSSNDAFSFVIFTVGAWPNLSEPYTQDGIHKVMALDLVARHVILSRLASVGLLCKDGPCTVMSVLAAAQNYPSFLIGDSNAIRSRMKECVVNLENDAKSNKGSNHYNHRGMCTLLDASICHDAWLQHMTKKLPENVSLIATFPGLMKSEIVKSTFPAWLVPFIEALMWPVADTQNIMGINHASILVAPGVRQKRVSYWVAPLLEAHEISAIANDEGLGEWTYNWLEEIVRLHSGENDCRTMLST